MRAPRAGFVLLLLSIALAVLLQLIALPDWMRASRPYWVPLVLSFWALTQPSGLLLVIAALAGVALDVAFGTALGQHALANVIVVYLITRLRPIFVLLDTWQVMCGLIPLWTLYAFLLFWLDGLTAHSADSTLRWLPIIATTLAWPVVYWLLNRSRQIKRDD